MTTALVTLNLPGNTARTFYDGIDRVLKTEQDLRVGGQGQNPIDTSNPANPDGIVTLIQAWDGNSRLLSRADDLGNSTHYDHDALDRPFRETYADGRMALRTFDRDDNVKTLTDQNVSIRTCAYDGVHRMVSCSVQRGPGVVGTTLQAWEYDGLFRSTRAFDDNEPLPATDDAIVTMIYDSLSREIEEHQKLGTDDRVVSWDIQDDDLRKAFVYPNGRRIAYTWDDLDRPKTVTNVSGAPQAGLLASWEYIGPGRVLFRTYGNGTRMTVDYDGDQRVLQCRHLKGSQLLAGFGYAHDRMDNRLTEARQHLSQTSDGWDYDSIYRLVDQKRDIPMGGGTPDVQKLYTLNGAGSWATLAIISGGTQTFNQTMDPLNSYTLFQDKAQADDFNGNRKDDADLLYKWDFLDRGRQVLCKGGGEIVSSHLYDAWGANGHLNGSGRRVRKTVTRDRHGCSGSFEAPEGGDEDDDTEEPHAPGQGCSRRKAADIRFLWDGWSLVEERDAATLKVLRQYVDMGMDRHLCMDAYKRNGTRLKRTLFYHEDAKGWVAALTDKNGHVRERYAYDAYGLPTFLDGHGRARRDQRESRLGNPHLYNGCYFDSETGLYPMRHRVYSPGQGRFLSRDPIGIWGDGINDGNGYGYTGNNPANGGDPEGLDDPTGPYQLGYEWLTGKGPPTHWFTYHDPMTQGLRDTPEIKNARLKALNLVIANCRNCVNADQQDSIWRSLAKDPLEATKLRALQVMAGGLLGGNIPAIYLGGFDGTWKATKISCCKGEVTLSFHVENTSGAKSGTRIPGLGYKGRPTIQTQFMSRIVIQKVNQKFGWQVPVPRWVIPGGVFNDNPFGSTGPLSNKKQVFDWEEKRYFAGNPKCKD